MIKLGLISGYELKNYTDTAEMVGLVRESHKYKEV
jgi:hypothetical protein